LKALRIAAAAALMQHIMRLGSRAAPAPNYQELQQYNSGDVVIDIHRLSSAVPPPPQQMMMHPGNMLSIQSVFLAFCEVGDSRTSYWRTLNRRLQKWRTGPLDHVEVVFVMSDRSARVVSLIKEGAARVQFELRNMDECYNRQYWTNMALPLNEQQRTAMYTFIANQNFKPFNQRYYCHFMPCWLWWCFGVDANDDSKWFCSQLVTAALKYTDPATFEPLDPRYTSPSMLYDFLRYKKYKSPFMQIMVNTSRIHLSL
jgi:hypothetical protein